MTFYVIGNGFDCHYGLKTSYFHFKKFLLDNGYGELVHRVDTLFWERGYSPYEIEYWSDFENMLTVFGQLYADDIYNEAMDNAETDDDRAGYWDSPAWNVGFYNQYIKVLKEQFDLWINEMDVTIEPDHYFCPECGDFVLNFNYTPTIERNFDIKGTQILHIHGTTDQEIILGHNEYQDPDLFSVIEDEDSDYRDVTTRKAVNDVLEQASVQYFKNSSELLMRHAHVFENIVNYDRVIFMGLSCGDQDSIYVQEIVKHAKQIVFYYHGDTAKENMEYFVNSLDIPVEYMYW